MAHGDGLHLLKTLFESFDCRFFCDDSRGELFFSPVDRRRLTLITRRVTICLGMIKSFRSDETEKIFSREPSRKLPHEIQRVALRKLLMLDAATGVDDLRVPPGNRLEELHGDRKGQWSIRINDQWRICFRWHEGNAYDVEIADYH